MEMVVWSRRSGWTKALSTQTLRKGVGGWQQGELNCFVATSSVYRLSDLITPAADTTVDVGFREHTHAVLTVVVEWLLLITGKSRVIQQK